VATIAFDSSDERPAKPPISAHPAFPAIVALWFAALLGLGSLVLPPILLERFATATGLASLVPAFAPPLGFTARALLALAAALVGVGLGLSIARRVARGNMPQPENRAAKLTKRPISVHDELGGEGVINGHGLPINRRRALAISEDERPSDFLYVAPLPGEDPLAMREPGEEPAAAAAIEEEPLELSEIASEAVPEDFAETAAAEEEDEMTDKQEFQPVSPFATFDEPEPDVVEELDARKNAAGPRGLEPLPFSAPSLARRAPRPSLEVTMALPEPQPRQEFVRSPEPVAFEPAPAPDPEPEAEPLRSDWQTAPTESLGLVQLVQRLGATIEKRREWVAAGAAAAASASAPAPLSGVEAAPAEEAAEGLAAFFGSAATVPDMAGGAEEEADARFAQAEPIAEEAPAARPAFLRGVADDDDDADDDDELPDFSLPLGRAASAQLAEDEPTDEGGEDETDEPAENDGFTSLLDMRNPFEAAAPEFVRIEEPEPDADDAEPAVVFPSAAAAQPVAEFGSAPPSRRFDPPGKAAPSFGASQSAPADADAALRAALATLQRMSGAA
jgi:hypothetical protein